MKIIEKIEKANADNRCFWSFEYFPPKTELGMANLYDRMDRMYGLGPEFVDVTWNAGGSSSDITLRICSTAQAVYGLETCMHLTCTNMPREKIDIALREAKNAGIKNILALRGDPPRGQENWTKCDTGFSYAADLVSYIRKEYQDFFCIGVAGYPEGHLENPDKNNDLLNLKAKVDAGADYIITQLFYDVEIYLEWLDKLRSIGVTIPVIPGIMPIQNYSGFKRMTTMCKTTVPNFILEELEPIKDDDKAVKDYGVQLATQMCIQMRDAGQRGFHFYTLNLERSTRLILEQLAFIAPMENVKPLPWNPSLARNREKENVRPIFWRNRVASYVQRTESWDEFPNGRWGDSRSPAFGNIDVYGINLKYPAAECLELWGYPKTVDDIKQVFVNYCRNEISALPWSDCPLSPESENITLNLEICNSLGFLTINSQPAVDGEFSSHPLYGWGPKNGFVYQKAYIEFFISAEMLSSMIEKIKSFPYFTFYAVNKHGDLKTNTVCDTPTAVTWGVFPGQEIIQPTIVEASSFMAWKDEAFEIWNQWESLYQANSEHSNLIKGISDTWYLMNIVDNNFKSEFGIFEIFQNNESVGL